MRYAVTEGFAPFRRPIFTAFWVAYLVSALGTQVQVVGAAWLMTAMTASPSEVALITAANALPVLLLASVSGAICDLFDKRLVLIIAQSVMLTAATVLAAFTRAQLVTPWLLIGCTFAIGCGFALNAPAWQSVVRELVPAADVPAAIAANSLAFNSGRMVGPAIGGLVVAAAGAAAAFLTNALSYLGPIIILLFWRAPSSARMERREHLFGAIITGARYAAYAPTVRAILWRAAMFGASSAGVLALLPLIARQRLPGGPLAYGILLGALGVGSIAGGISITPVRAQIGPSGAVKLAFLMAALASVAITGSHSSLLLHVGVFGLGMATVMALSTLNAAIQLSVPRWVVGRVISLHQTALFGGLAGGSVLWGRVASHFGLAAAVGGSAASLTVLRLLSARFKVSLETNDPLSALAPEIVDLAIPEALRHDPIITVIEYRIPLSVMPEFTILMEQQRLRRMRSGARQWMLLRSAADDALWCEQFRTRNWAHHLHHNARRTLDDARLQSGINALHVGAQPPPVRYYVGAARTGRLGGFTWAAKRAAANATTEHEKNRRQ